MVASVVLLSVLTKASKHEFLFLAGRSLPTALHTVQVANVDSLCVRLDVDAGLVQHRLSPTRTKKQTKVQDVDTQVHCFRGHLEPPRVLWNVRELCTTS